jgi:23S rRNA (uracil1939-C5)-methyltransferase
MTPFNNPTAFPVTIEKIIPGGRGLAFHEGRVVFVPSAVPQDRLLVRQIKDRNSYLEVEVLEILAPSPDRGVPPCPYFGVCGGCDLQQIQSGQQLVHKRGILLDALERIGKIQLQPGQVTMISSPPAPYRNRLQIKIAHGETGSTWGFYQAASHHVTRVDQCLIALDPLWQLIKSLKVTLRELPAIEAQLSGLEVLSGDEQSFLIELQFQDEVSNIESL